MEGEESGTDFTEERQADAFDFSARHEYKACQKISACLNSAQYRLGMFFREYFPVVMRRVAGYVTKGNGGKAQNRLNKKLKKEKLDRL